MSKLDTAIIALRTGDIEWLEQNSVDVDQIKDRYIQAIYDSSTKTLQWLEQRGFKIKDIDENYSSNCSFKAGKLGYKDVLKYLNKYDCLQCDAYMGAANDLELVKWLWKLQSLTTPSYINRVVGYLIRKQKYQAFQWLDSIIPDNLKINYVSTIIKSCESAETLDWLAEHGHKLTSDDLNQNLNLFGQSMEATEDFKILKWMDEHGHNIDSRLLEAAAEGNLIDVLKWAHQRGHKIEIGVLRKILNEKDYVTANWLHSIGLRVDDELIDDFIGYQDLECLKWAYEHDYKFESDHLSAAAQSFDVEIMDWLDSIGIRGNDDDLLEDIDNLEDQLPEYLLWLFEHKYRIPEDKIKVLKKIQNSKQKG